MSIDNIAMKLNTTHKSKIIIGIIGGHAHNTNAQALEIAKTTGEKLSQAGNDNPVPVADIVVTGDQQNGFTLDIREVVPSQTPTITFGEF